MRTFPTLYLVGLNAKALAVAQKRANADGYGQGSTCAVVYLNLSAKPEVTLAGRRIQEQDIAYNEAGRITLDQLRDFFLLTVGHPG